MIQEPFQTKVDRTLDMLNALLDATTAAVFIKDTEGRYLLANHATAAFVGKPVEEIIGHDDFHLFPSADAKFLKERDRRIMESDSVDTAEENLQIHGETRTSLTTKGAVRASDGKVIGLFGISRDITERKIAEEKIQQLNRVYALLSNVNQAIVRMRDRKQLFDEICRIAVEDGKFRMAWIGEVDENTTLVRIAASFGSTGDYLNNIGISINDIPEGQGPVGRAIRSGTHVISSDIEHDENMKLWRSNALRNGYRSLASFPITVSGRTIGALSLYATEVGFFSDQEVILLDELADDISYALQFIAAEENIAKATQAIRQSMQQQKAILSNIPDIAWLKDTESRFIAVNEPFGNACGKKADELVGKSDLDIWPTELAERYRADDREVMQSGRRKIVEEPLVDAAGMSIWIETVKTPIFDEKGSVIGTTGIARDITDRKKMHEALQEKEYLLSESQKIAHIGSWAWNLTGPIQWTDETYRIFGVSPETFTPTIESLVSLLHPDDRPAMQAWIGTCVDGEEPGDLVFRTLLPDGNARFLSGRGRLEHDANGKAVQMVGTVQDITGQYLTKVAFEEQKKFAESLIENSAVATFVIDSEHKVILWNKACERLTGIAAADMLGSDNQWKPFYSHKRHTLSDVIIDGNILDLPSLYDKYSPSPLIGGGLRAEGWYLNLNSKDRYIMFDAAPIFGSNDNLICAIETLQDLTEQRRLEEQLQHAQKLEGIGQLAGGIAHDFNNILNAVVGFGSLAQMNIDSPSRLKDYLAEVVAAGQRGASLTHQLLAFSRKQKLDIKQVNLNALINNLMKLLHRLIREDIKLSFIPAAYDLFIMADSSQIDQVIINLITNARDSIQRIGEITITAEPIFIDTDFTHMHGFGVAGQYALVSISDTGTGMDRQTIDRIFEPFFTTKEVGKGTGLGLAVVYGIIKQHNGFVNVYSELGKGTTFKIYLPITTASVDRAKETEIIPPSGGTETILIADDDRALRGLLQALLEQFGYTVITAEDGADAISKFRENRDTINIMILDAIMPNKNGQEAFDEIIAMAPDIKAIFLSGYTKDIIDHQKLTEKETPFLAKPILPNDLLRKIREVLDRRDMHA